MNLESMTSAPVTALVSVIIPCYNHGRFLADAIKSVLEQTYKAIEIIVVDDGSKDNTKEVAMMFPHVKYIFQYNQGLSSARNTGIKNSKGEYLAFLDADDIFYEDALDYNLNILKKNPSLAFVSGAYLLKSDQNEKIPKQREIDPKNAYLLLLKRNYIEMHSTVMFRRFVFDEFLYDTKLKACEDYDLYLKIARKYSVAQHSKILTEYRMHGDNMSGNPQLMLDSVLIVLERQKQFIQSKEEELSLAEGIEYFKKYYSSRLIRKIKYLDEAPDNESLKVLKRFKRKFYYKYRLMEILKKIINSPRVKNNSPDFLRKLFF